MNMKWYNKLFNSFKTKSFTTGGLEVVQRLFGGAGRWSKTKQLAVYTKSLYVYACVRKIAEKVGSQDIRLFKIINKLEFIKVFDDSGRIQNISKIRMKPMEVSLGKVNNCVINTSDFSSAMKAIGDNDSIFGVELVITSDKIVVYFDLDGQIRVSVKSDNIDNVEALAIEYAGYL